MKGTMRFRPCCLTRRSEKAVRGSEKIGDVKLNTGNVLGVEFAASTTEEAVRLTAAHIKDLSGGYICFSHIFFISIKFTHIVFYWQHIYKTLSCFIFFYSSIICFPIYNYLYI